MSIGLIGKKLGMTREFYDSGISVPVTVLSIEKGRILDVFTKEPPDSDDPILSAKNIIFTPHNAALTLECRTRMSIETIENILSHLNNNTNIGNIINKNIL